MQFYKNYTHGNLSMVFNGKTYIEKWRPVAEFGKYYQVSSFGRVKSLRDNRIMKQHINDSGYLVLRIHGDGKKFGMKVHRLVAFAFIKNPHNKPQVNHEDFNKTNNFYLNLTWMTGKENTNHAQQGGKVPFAKPKPPKPEERPVYYRKVINIETNVVYDCVLLLAKLIGANHKTLTRKLCGERYNDTPYRYLKDRYKHYPKQYARDEAKYYELRKTLLGY